ncbi:hypothetical protein ACVWZV_000969 [Bradyrhizobium sp. GM5.1]
MLTDHQGRTEGLDRLDRIGAVRLKMRAWGISTSAPRMTANTVTVSIDSAKSFPIRILIPEYIPANAENLAGGR